MARWSGLETQELGRGAGGGGRREEAGPSAGWGSGCGAAGFPGSSGGLPAGSASGPGPLPSSAVVRLCVGGTAARSVGLLACAQPDLFELGTRWKSLSGIAFLL